MMWCVHTHTCMCVNDVKIHLTSKRPELPGGLVASMDALCAHGPGFNSQQTPLVSVHSVS